MASLRTAMDSAFWDLNVSSPHTLEGSAKAIPGDPFPLDGARASRALRIHQLSLLGTGFPLGIIPSYSPASHKDSGSFSLQSLLLRPATSNWWLGVIGQIRPKKLISSIKAEFFTNDELEVPTFKDAARHFLDKSLNSVGLCTEFLLTPASSVKLSTEGDGEKKGRRSKVMLSHEGKFLEGSSFQGISTSVCTLSWVGYQESCCCRDVCASYKRTTVAQTQ